MNMWIEGIMAENPMLKFVQIPRLMPEKREAIDRTQDFGEIYSDFEEAKVGEQASRCSQCEIGRASCRERV